MTPDCLHMLSMRMTMITTAHLASVDSTMRTKYCMRRRLRTRAWYLLEKIVGTLTSAMTRTATTRTTTSYF